MLEPWASWNEQRRWRQWCAALCRMLCHLSCPRCATLASASYRPAPSPAAYLAEDQAGPAQRGRGGGRAGQQAQRLGPWHTAHSTAVRQPANQQAPPPPRFCWALGRACPAAHPPRLPALTNHLPPHSLYRPSTTQQKAQQYSSTALTCQHAPASWQPPVVRPGCGPAPGPATRR